MTKTQVLSEQCASNVIKSVSKIFHVSACSVHNAEALRSACVSLSAVKVDNVQRLIAIAFDSAKKGRSCPIQSQIQEILVTGPGVSVFCLFACLVCYLFYFIFSKSK